MCIGERLICEVCEEGEVCGGTSGNLLIFFLAEIEVDETVISRQARSKISITMKSRRLMTY